MSKLEWDYRPNLDVLATTLRLTLNNGLQSELIGKTTDFKLQEFQFKPDVHIAIIKVWFNASKELFGLEFQDRMRNKVCKLGKEGFRQSTITLLPNQFIVGLKATQSESSVKDLEFKIITV